MNVKIAPICFAVIILVTSRRTPPTFSLDWSKHIEYVRVPEPKSINCHAKADPPAKYYWTFNGANITWDKSIISFSVNNETLTTGPKFEESNSSGEYQCTAYNDHGTLVSPLLKIMAAFHGSFTGDVEIKMLEVYESKYIKLECEGVTENIPKPQFNWYRGKTRDPGQFVKFEFENRIIIDHEGSLHFLWTQQEDSYSYVCATYNSVFLSTKRNPRIVKLDVRQGTRDDREPELKYNQDVEVYAGDNVVLMCIFSYFSKNGKLSLIWWHRGEKVHTGLTYPLNDVQLPSYTHDLEGEYLVEATLGSAKKFGKVNLKIVGPPTFLPGQAPETKFVPVEKDAVIECKTESHNSHSFPPVWFKNGKPLSGCPKYYFECNTRGTNGYSQCVLEEDICNNVRHCADGTVQTNCLVSCPSHQKRCGDQCIPESDHCQEPTCNYPDFMCHDKRSCVTQDKICDGIKDCPHGSDEHACPGGEDIHVDRVNINSARTRLTLPNVRLQDTMCFQCMVRNEYGSVYGDACLTVIDKIRVQKPPSSEYNVEPGSRLEITVNATTDPIWQKQMSYVWQWYEEVTDEKTGTKFTVPVTLPTTENTAAFFHLSPKGTNMTIVFPEVKEDDDTAYAVYQEMTDRLYTLIIKHQYDRVEFNFTVNGKSISKPAPVVETASTNLWFIALILGILLLFIVVALFVCYMYRNRGGTYLVDEKEKGAGNDPVQELKDGGFHDVGRVADEDNVDGPEGDKASLSESVKPYESDDDPTDEYGGDFDVSKFNEDGSFIGVYIEKRPGLNEVTV